MGVLHSFLPLKTTSSLVFSKLEQKWVCLFHGILQPPCSLIGTKVLPLHLYLFDGSVLKQCHLLVEDAHRLHFGTLPQVPPVSHSNQLCD